MLEAWRGASRRARLITIVVVIIVALEALLATVGYLTGGSGPTGPASSSYATAPKGLAAYADLLEVQGHPVTRLRTRLHEARLDGEATIVLLDPSLVLREEQIALGRWLASGGRLIAGGTEPSWLGGVLDDTPEWGSEGPAEARPLAPVPEVGGVGAVRSEQQGAWWSDPRGALPILGVAGDPEAGALATVVSVGAGRAVLLADASPLQNRLLGAADNAAFGLAAAGPEGRPVVFSEAVHGYGAEQGLAALPRRWRAALGGLGLAALVWLVARARRLGPPEDAERALPPPRSAYVHAQAASLARTGAPGSAVAPVRTAARARLAAGAGLGPGASDEDLGRAARRFGLDESEVDAMLGEVSGDPGVLAAGRALAKLARRPSVGERP